MNTFSLSKQHSRVNIGPIGVKNITFPNYQRVTLWEAQIRASEGNEKVDSAFHQAGLTGNEPPFKVRTFVAKWNALRELDPSIALPPKTREAIQAIGGAVRPAVMPVAAPAKQTIPAVAGIAPLKTFAPAAPQGPTSPARPAVDGNLRGLDRVRASIRADMQAGTHGLQPAAAESDPWKLPASLASVPRVGNKIDRLTLDQLGVLAVEVFGEVATCLLVASSEGDAETLHRLERQFFVEGLTIPGQTPDSFSANLRMTPQTTGLAGVSHRRQQCQVDAFVAHLES